MFQQPNLLHARSLHFSSNRMLVLLVAAIGLLGFVPQSQVEGAESPHAKRLTFRSADDLPVQAGLPDPFVGPDGKRINSREQWPAQRDYLKAMMAYYLYGSMPPRPESFKLERTQSKSLFDGKAVAERYAITLERNERKVTFHFELIRPANNSTSKNNTEPKRFPVIVKNGRVFFDGQEPAATRDLAAAKEAIARGYLLCKFQCNELADDKPNNRRKGVFPLYPEYDWGTIAAWAWGHSVVVDALDELQLADMKRIVVTGHSRGGKTALCAGIYDERIAITAPNSSGTGGTSSLRYFEKGQKQQGLILHKKQFPHWWVGRHFQFDGKENRLPFDAHTAKALIAPRGLINAHAKQDYWANPFGTELTYRAANKMFDWLDAKDKQGLHWRDGGHAQNQQDWLALLDFADWQFFGKKPIRSFTTLAYPNAKLPVNWQAP